MTTSATAARRSVRGMRSDALRNREDLLSAATVALHREGKAVPMAAIAAQAGVGVGTLYRHFPDRDALLAELTHRSFEQVLVNAVTAEASGATPIEALRQFIEAVMSQRNELVLPLHGGPRTMLATTARTRNRIHEIMTRIVDRGKADGSIRADVDPFDIIAWGALLSQPNPQTPNWDVTCRRLLATYLRGLAV